MKKVCKDIFRLAATLAVLPLYLAYLLLNPFLPDRVIFPFFSQLLSTLPGVFGDYLRYSFYYLTLKSCGRDVVISFGVIFATSEVEVGNSVYIGPYSSLGKCNIDDNTLLASRVSIVSGKNQHGIADLNKPIREQEGEFSLIEIGKDSWIGESSTIAANIGKGCVVGLGSVVVEEVRDFEIVGGNPARLIKNRAKQV